MTFITGEGKIINIGPIPNEGGSNSLEMILRESGRFIIRGEDEFIALSEKKTRTITITGTIGADSSAEHVSEYEATPGVSQFASADMFPQDMLNEYAIEEIEIYGVASLLNMSVASEPADAVVRLKGAHIKEWISRQPLTSWNPEDCIGMIFSAYQSIPVAGMKEITEGVLLGTVQKNRIPIFTPIKSSFSIQKLKDILYLYTNIQVLGYCAASTAGGSMSGTAVLDQRLVIGQGFLPEEVEELLSPSQ